MDMDDAAQVKTLAHELGHVMLHGPDHIEAILHRGLAEVEAESVALMIGAAHGLDTSAYTVPYVASWASNVPDKTPQRSSKPPLSESGPRPSRPRDPRNPAGRDRRSPGP